MLAVRNARIVFLFLLEQHVANYERHGFVNLLLRSVLGRYCEVTCELVEHERPHIVCRFVHS